MRIGPRRAKLEEKRLAATEQLFALQLNRGDCAAGLVPQLGELVCEQPLREEARRLLMLALHRSGRKADALNVYEQGRRLLVDELGVDPGVDPRGRSAPPVRRAATQIKPPPLPSLKTPHSATSISKPSR